MCLSLDNPAGCLDYRCVCRHSCGRVHRHAHKRVYRHATPNDTERSVRRLQDLYGPTTAILGQGPCCGPEAKLWAWGHAVGQRPRCRSRGHGGPEAMLWARGHVAGPAAMLYATSAMSMRTTSHAVGPHVMGIGRRLWVWTISHEHWSHVRGQSLAMHSFFDCRLRFACDATHAPTALPTSRAFFCKKHLGACQR